jgi:hypothetical protein
VGAVLFVGGGSWGEIWGLYDTFWSENLKGVDRLKGIDRRTWRNDIIIDKTQIV